MQQLGPSQPTVLGLTFSFHVGSNEDERRFIELHCRQDSTDKLIIFTMSVPLDDGGGLVEGRFTKQMQRVQQLVGMLLKSNAILLMFQSMVRDTRPLVFPLTQLSKLPLTDEDVKRHQEENGDVPIRISLQPVVREE